MYRVSEAAKIFRTNSTTIGQWADEHSIYFSENVNKSGGYRRFDEDDMKILSLISELRNAGKASDDIRAALEAGQRGLIPNFPLSNTERQESGNRIKELESQLNQESYLHHKAQGKVDLLKEQLREALAEIARLNRLLGPEK